MQKCSWWPNVLNQAGALSNYRIKLKGKYDIGNHWIIELTKNYLKVMFPFKGNIQHW